MFTLEEYKKAWEESGKYGTPDERIKRNKLWMPYYSFVAEQMLGTHYTENKNARDMLQFLINEKAYSRNRTQKTQASTVAKHFSV